MLLIKGSPGDKSWPTGHYALHGRRRIFNLDTAMSGSRAERLARRTASAATAPPAGNPRGRPRGNTAPARRVDPEPRVEHPEDDDIDHTEDDLGEEEASSLHPSRDRVEIGRASCRERV